LLTKHGVEKDEVRQIFTRKPWIIFVERGHRPDENVYSAFGQTDGGRYLIVFFVHKKDQRALIVSARGMTVTERRRYAKR
jgi:hypothetical protein